MKTFPILIILLISLNSCTSQIKKMKPTGVNISIKNHQFFKLSLAQWSLHKSMIDHKTIVPLDFAKVAKEMGFEGVEYVSFMYKNELESLGMNKLVDLLNAKSKQYNIKNLLIMVDGEGELSNPDKSERDEAILKHTKWIDAAADLGCHSIRVNLYGTIDSSLWKTASIDGLKRLSIYAKTKNINVIVENHGYLSSNAKLLVEVIKEVNMPNCGTLPDFGNFCLKRENNEQWNTPCIEEYDMYKGVEEMMPYAKAVSAKSYNFDNIGNETKIDYLKMLQIVKDAGYTGFIGVEFETNDLPEKEGIMATKDLLIKVSTKLK